ncbi:hypothetical protein Ddye_020470 [Dipteronia dyeriana]|uniref:Uncharacterized protein n=1 Tax=Dipteronia dyeriana TaxID=168575 RepID=A0AAD9TZS0_9ROSI|nr:hypothetical protein Ddye_020470 [Dipteronia dyeriana]
MRSKSDKDGCATVEVVANLQRRWRSEAGFVEGVSGGGAEVQGLGEARQPWRWWRMYNDDGDVKPTLLGEFLEVEQRLGESGTQRFLRRRRMS